MNGNMVRAMLSKLGSIAVAACLSVGFVSVAHASTLGLTDNRDYNGGPLLANWSTQNNVFYGVSTNYWEDNNTAFQNNSITYASGIGMHDTATVAGYNEWWLGGTYTNFTGTVRMDSVRGNGNSYATVSLIGDGTTLATVPGILQNDSATFNNVNVTGVKMLRLQVVQTDFYGGRLQNYVFWTQADVSGTPGHYYHDTLTAGTSSAHPELGNSVTFSSAQNQAGGAGTTPSINTWLDTSLPLTVGGQTVQGVGFRAPAFGTTSTGSVSWALSPGNNYELFTFDLARDDRWGSGTHTSLLTLQLDGLTVGTWDLDSAGTPQLAASVLLNGATNVTFFMTGTSFGGASTAYIDIINPEFIATIPEPSVLFLIAVGGACMYRSRKRK